MHTNNIGHSKYSGREQNLFDQDWRTDKYRWKNVICWLWQMYLICKFFDLLVISNLSALYQLYIIDNIFNYIFLFYQVLWQILQNSYSWGTNPLSINIYSIVSRCNAWAVKTIVYTVMEEWQKDLNQDKMTVIFVIFFENTSTVCVFLLRKWQLVVKPIPAN